MIGKTLGSYRVIDKLGEGGMGAVYLAEHPLLGRRAAVKVLLPHLCNEKEIVDRFFREARAATLIKHAGIVDIFDFGYADSGSAYIVMEFLEGESLTSRIERLGSLPETEAIRLGRQAAGALAAAHRAGIVHRDLKPDNLFVVPDGDVIGGERLKILDFGIAKLIAAGEQTAGTSKTRTGTVMGSPLYMAPEQCRGAEETDERTDVYALGCVLYHAACGRPPFDAPGVGDVLAKHIYEPVVPPRSLRPQLTEGFEALLMQCLAKKPVRRPQTMSAMISALDDVSAGRFSSGAVAAFETPPTGVPVVSETMAASPRALVPRKLDTTLGASSGQLSLGSYAPPVRSRRTLAFALAAAVVAVGAAVAIVTTRPGDSPAAAAPVAAASTPAVTPAAEPAQVPAAESPPAQPVPATPARVTFEIASEPAGALVRNAETKKVIGETPYASQFEADGSSHRFEITKDGFEPGAIELIADRDRRADTVVLTAVAANRPDRRTTSRRRPASTSTRPDKPDKPAATPPGSTPKPRPSGFGETANPFPQ